MVSFRIRFTADRSFSHRYPKGLGQTFTQPANEWLDAGRYSAETLLHMTQNDRHAVVIVICTVAGNEELASPPSSSSGDTKKKTRGGVQSQSTFCQLSLNADGTYGIKVLKQRIMVDGRKYDLQEIYGLDQSDANMDGGRECVICMSDVADTAVLPCRHMCLCNKCADALRYQSSRCPICRTPIQSLWHITKAPETKKAEEGQGGKKDKKAIVTPAAVKTDV